MLTGRARVYGSLTCCLILYAGPVKGQRIYAEPEDWQYIPSMAAITSASESPYGIYFSTMDGVIFYDYFTQQLSPAGELNAGLPSRQLYQTYFDETSDGLWVVYDDGIAFQLRSDNIWRFVPSSALPVNFRGSSVRRLGGNYDGVWVDRYGVYTQLNAFTGRFMRQDIVYPDIPVNWNVSRAGTFEPPSLMGWFTSSDWTTNISEFVGPGFMRAQPTFTLQDQHNDVWFGTDVGVLFRGDLYSRQLVTLQSGIVPRPVITLLIDGDRTWFADNRFRRDGNPPARGGYFLSSYDEAVSTWRHYHSLASEAIRDVGINDMLREGRYLWLATMSGILLLDTRRNSWSTIGPSAGLRDRAIWDMVEHGGKIFVATNQGIDMIDPASRRVIRADSTFSDPQTDIYALHSTGEYLYAGTAQGVYEYKDEGAEKWRRIFSLPVRSLWADGQELYVAANNLVYHRGPGNPAFEIIPIPQLDGARILEIAGYGSYIWLATSRGALVVAREGSRQFLFNRNEGLPSDVVYAVVPTAQWVWFLTAEGVIRFNWRAYFE